MVNNNPTVQKQLLRNRLRIALNEAHAFPDNKELFSCLSLYTNEIYPAETFLKKMSEGMIETLGHSFHVIFAHDLTRGELLRKTRSEDFSRRLGKTVAIEKTLVNLEFRKPSESWALPATVFVSLWKI